MHDAERLANQLIADVARRIGELRAAAGLSQADVAERIGTTVSNYQRIEHGLQNVTLRTLARIAAAIMVTPAQLFVAPHTARPGRGRPPTFGDASRPRGELLAVAERGKNAAASKGPATPYEARRLAKPARKR